MTLRQARDEGTKILKSSSIDTPELDSLLLLLFALRKDRAWFIVHEEDEIEDEVKEEYFTLIKKRRSHTPYAYITGEKEFYGRPFHVDGSTLIPRPDTETLVEVGIEAIDEKDNVLDLCTGSGCVGVTVAAETGCHVTLSDIDVECVKAAGKNAGRYLEGCKFKVVQSDLFSKIDGKFDAILSNPPYLTEEWYGIVSEEVRGEPRKSLLGFGDDGLGLIRKIISQSPAFLANGGLLALECDYRQAHDCAILLEKRGFKDVSAVKDLSGRERVVKGIYDGCNP